MSKKLISISIFVLMAIFCVCGFVSFDHNNMFIAAANEGVECYTLVARDALADTKSTYQADRVVGSMDRTGYYVVGNPATLKATAQTGYYVAGFQITYLDQSNKTDYVWLESGNITTYTLSYADDTSSVLTITKELGAPVSSLERASVVSAHIVQVGENLQLTPIYDHLYSRIKIDNSQAILTSGETKTDSNGTTLYYSNTWTSVLDGVQVYENAYVEDNNVRYYYGTVYLKDNVFYTLHEKQDATGAEERIPLLEGAFRQDETPSVNLAVNDYYDVLDIQVLRDNQFISEKQSASVQIEKAAEQNTYNIALNNYSMQFNTALYADLELSIKAHKLYKVDLQFLVDNEALIEDHYEDFFGDVYVTSSNVKANVSSSNYFSAFENINVGDTNYPTQYFIKSYDDNNKKAFTIQGVQKILKVEDGLEYNYYSFSAIEINGVSNDDNSISFNNPTDTEITVKVHYDAVKYNVNLEYRENLMVCLLKCLANKLILSS